MKSITVLQTQRQTLKEYLLVKLAQDDMHGVRDCAVDIELIDVQIKMLREFTDED